MADHRPAPLDPWLQQPNEGAKAYAAFRVYLEQGPEHRSQRAVADQLGKSLTLISRWAAQYDWVERVAHHDRRMIEVVQAALEDEVAEMSKRHAQVAVAFQNKVVARLQEIQPDELTPAQLIQWFEVASRIERQARGMPDLTLGAIRPVDAEQEAIDAGKVVALDNWLRALPPVIDVEEVGDDDDAAQAEA